ncbi:MAG: hypothetical protein ABFC78_08455 [Methanoregula sp.]|jgi:hypothetical protein
MKQNNKKWRRGLIIGILVLLISFALVGTVAAADTPDPHGHDSTVARGTLTGTSGSAVLDNDMMDSCQKMMANNSMMSGSMLGGGMIGTAGAQMMESVEVNAMGQPMHDEMQGLVAKMMAGNIDSSDQARMVEIMNKYPGASNMMMTRMMGGTGQGWSGYSGRMGTGGAYSSAGMMGGYGTTGGAGMMNTGFMSLGAILVVLFFVVWLVVGILAIIWLIKQLQKDKIPS